MVRRHRHLHHARIPFPRGRYSDDQFPPAEIDAVHARFGFLRSRDDACRLCACHRNRIPFLFLWRFKPVVPEELMHDKFTFTLKATSGGARLGEVAMPRGVIRTPAFMPVGTVGTVKAM